MARTGPDKPHQRARAQRGAGFARFRVADHQRIRVKEGRPAAKIARLDGRSCIAFRARAFDRPSPAWFNARPLAAESADFISATLLEITMMAPSKIEEIEAAQLRTGLLPEFRVG